MLAENNEPSEINEEEYSQVIVEEKETIISGSSMLASSQYYDPQIIQSGYNSNALLELPNEEVIVKFDSPERSLHLEETCNKENNKPPKQRKISKYYLSP
jgi:hypothetical protein